MNEIEKLMKTLGCSKEEALEILEADKAIDKGEKLFELSADQEKESKKARSAGTKKPTVYNFDTSKRKRKEKPDKQELMKTFAETLKGIAEGVEITNIERELVFTYNNVGYKLTLAVPRVKPSE